MDISQPLSHAVLADNSDTFLDELRRLGGSPQGARPKALIQIESDSGKITGLAGAIGS